MGAAGTRGPAQTTGLAALAGTALVLLGVPGTGRPDERPLSAGAAIAFLRDGDVWTMREDGSEQAQLTHLRDVGFLSWSLDGRRIAFARPNAIWVMTDTGHRVREVVRTGHPGARLGAETDRLVERGCSLSEPCLLPTFTWLPDGRHLAFASPDQVCVVRVSTGVISQVTHFAEGWCDEVCSSPDGRQLAFVHLQPLEKAPDETDGPHWHRERLHLLDLQTSELTCIVDGDEPGPQGERLIVSLSFGLGGPHLIYSDVPHAFGDGRVTSVDLPTLQPSDLSDGSTGRLAHWYPVGSPKGEQLAALCFGWEEDASRYGDGIATYDPQVSAWRYYWLTPWDDPEPTHDDLSYSPDGTRIAYVQRAGHRAVPAVCVLNLRYGGVRRLTDNATMPRWRPRAATAADG